MSVLMKSRLDELEEGRGSDVAAGVEALRNVLSHRALLEQQLTTKEHFVQATPPLSR